MGFKSGIAAEVIGVPGRIDRGRSVSRKDLSEHAELFAWTFMIIVVSTLFEKLFLWILKKFAGKGALIDE